MVKNRKHQPRTKSHYFRKFQRVTGNQHKTGNLRGIPCAVNVTIYAKILKIYVKQKKKKKQSCKNLSCEVQNRGT